MGVHAKYDCLSANRPHRLRLSNKYRFKRLAQSIHHCYDSSCVDDLYSVTQMNELAGWVRAIGKLFFNEVNTSVVFFIAS